jgi:hypothetical protein
MDYVYGPVDRVHTAGSWVHEPPLNNDHWFFDLRFRFNEAEGVSLDLIYTVGSGSDDRGSPVGGATQ